MEGHPATVRGPAPLTGANRIGPCPPLPWPGPARVPCRETLLVFPDVPETHRTSDTPCVPSPEGFPEHHRSQLPLTCLSMGARECSLRLWELGRPEAAQPWSAGAILPPGSRPAAAQSPRWASDPWPLSQGSSRTQRSGLCPALRKDPETSQSCPWRCPGPTRPPGQRWLMNPSQLGPIQWHLVWPVGAVFTLAHQGRHWGHEVNGCNPPLWALWANSGGRSPGTPGSNDLPSENTVPSVTRRCRGRAPEG